MSIKSIISYLNKDDVVVSVFCYYGGYVSYNGLILIENYQTYEKIDNLLKNGNIIELDEHIYQTKFYSNETQEHDSIESLLLNCNKDIEFVYLFDNNEWFVYQIQLYGNRKFKIRNILMLD